MGIMNMSYCRFQNTANDVEDCMDAIEEGVANLSVEEVMAGVRLFERVGRVMLDNGIVKNVWWGNIEQMMEALQEDGDE